SAPYTLNVTPIRRNISSARPHKSASPSGAIASSASEMGAERELLRDTRSSISSNRPSRERYAAQIGSDLLASLAVALIRPARREGWRRLGCSTHDVSRY